MKITYQLLAISDPPHSNPNSHYPAKGFIYFGKYITSFWCNKSQLIFSADINTANIYYFMCS